MCIVSLVNSSFVRYRLSLFKLLSVVRDALDRFMAIYALQGQCHAYGSPQELWEALGLYNLTQVRMYYVVVAAL